MTAARVQIIAYYRVSTKKQGRSGLGLEAQQHLVREHAARSGATITAEYTEILSGRRCDRKLLDAAIQHARRESATLVVAKLDRLARDARFLLSLVDSGVPIHFLDLPELATGDPIIGRLILTIMAGIAEFESRRTGQRVKEAIGRRKARLEAEGRKIEANKAHMRRAALAGGAVHRARCDEYRERVLPVVRRLREGQTLAATAAALNAAGCRTLKGREWSVAEVSRFLRHAERIARSE